MTNAAQAHRRWGNIFLGEGVVPQRSRSRRFVVQCLVFAGIALLGTLWGGIVALAELNALYLCVCLIACVFIVRDFRIGVVLLVLLMPISRSHFFPHAMMGITGLNPLNLLLVGTLGSYLLRELADGKLTRFIPRPLFWLYIVPIVIAGMLGSTHVREIAPALFMYDMFEFHDATGYIRDVVVKPLFLVLFALLVAGAVARSRQPEKFLVPALVSMWVMGLLVVVFVLASGIGLSALGSSASREFFSPLGLHANELGRLYATAYALLLFTWAQMKNVQVRVLLLATMGLVVVALLFTFSRGAFFGFAVVNLLFLLWHRNAKTLLFIGLLAVLALCVMPGAVYDRILEGHGSGLNAVSAGRIGKLWLPLIPDLLSSPFYGHGLGSILWSEAMRKGAGVSLLIVTHPHNAYLQALLDMGICGLLLLCAYYVHVWKRFRALGKEPGLSPELRGFYQGAAAGLASFLIAGMADSSLAPVPEQTFLWLAIGMMYGQLARLKREAEDRAQKKVAH